MNPTYGKALVVLLLFPPHTVVRINVFKREETFAVGISCAFLSKPVAILKQCKSVCTVGGMEWVSGTAQHSFRRLHTYLCPLNAASSQSLL